MSARPGKRKRKDEIEVELDVSSLNEDDDEADLQEEDLVAVESDPCSDSGDEDYADDVDEEEETEDDDDERGGGSVVEEGDEEESVKLPVEKKRADRRNKAVIDFSRYFAEYLSFLSCSTPPAPGEVPVSRIEEVLGEMLRDRGFPVGSGLKLNLTAFPALEVAKPGPTSATQRIHVYLSSTKKFGVKDARTIRDVIASRNEILLKEGEEVIQQIVIVTKCAMTHQARVVTDELSTNANVSTFRWHELRRPYPRHEAVPLHVREADPVATMKRLMATPTQMPIMDVMSSISRWYGYCTGDVIRIERKFGGYTQVVPFWRRVGLVEC